MPRYGRTEIPKTRAAFASAIFRAQAEALKNAAGDDADSIRAYARARLDDAEFVERIAKGNDADRDSLITSATQRALRAAGLAS